MIGKPHESKFNKGDRVIHLSGDQGTVRETSSDESIWVRWDDTVWDDVVPVQVIRKLTKLEKALQ